MITVYSAKGGVGKTTISCELAVYLALTDHGRGKYKVCIADFNIDFGDVMATLSYDPDRFCMTNWADEIREKLDALPEMPMEIIRKNSWNLFSTPMSKWNAGYRRTMKMDYMRYWHLLPMKIPWIFPKKN
ncbi:MAG: P-loop NTPase [Lachnospiraceae bacterium]